MMINKTKKEQMEDADITLHMNLPHDPIIKRALISHCIAF